VGKNHHCCHLCLLFIIKKNLLQSCIGADSYQHAGIHCRRLQPSLVLQHPMERRSNPLILFPRTFRKGAPTPWSDLPTTTGRKLQLPHSRLQPSTLPWTTFLKFSYWIHLLQNITTCKPCFIKFLDWTHYQHLSPKPNIKTAIDLCNKSPKHQLKQSLTQLNQPLTET